MFGRVLTTTNNCPFPPGYEFKTGVLCQNVPSPGTSSMTIPNTKKVIPLVIEGVVLSGGVDSRLYDNNSKNYWGINSNANPGLWSKYPQFIWIPGIYSYDWDLMKTITSVIYEPGIGWYNNDFRITAWLEKAGN